MPAHAERDIANATTRRPGLVLLAILVAGVLVNYAVVHPVRNYLLDFRAYYAAGTALRVDVNPYDISAVREHVKLPGDQQIVRYFYPPPTLGLMYGVALLPYPAAQVPWCILQAVLIVGALCITLRALRCPLGSPTSVLIAFALLTSSAVEELFRWGQFDMVLVALLAAALLALRRGRSTLAGAAIGLAVVAKVTPLLYLGVLLLRRDAKALLAATATILLLLGGSYAVLGGDVFNGWLHSLSEFGGEWATLANPKNMSLPAFIYRLLPAGVGPQVARAAALAASAAVILLTVWWMHRHRHRLTTAACLAAAVPVALLVCPVTWMHHGVQLLIPLAVMAVATMRQPRLHALDATWLVLTLLLYTNWPVERFALDLSPRLMHLTSPTLMYATGLAWLFMVLRYVPLTRRLTASAAQPSVPEAPAEFKPMGVTP